MKKFKCMCGAVHSAEELNRCTAQEYKELTTVEKAIKTKEEEVTSFYCPSCVEESFLTDFEVIEE